MLVYVIENQPILIGQDLLSDGTGLGTCEICSLLLSINIIEMFLVQNDTSIYELCFHCTIFSYKMMQRAVIHTTKLFHQLNVLFASYFHSIVR